MKNQVRQIIHFDLDSFFVSVERLKKPALAGIPLIVGGSEGRGVVSACSYETRAYGVHSAMPMRQALSLCPNAVVVKGDYPSYSYYSQLVAEILRNEVPVLEKASIDEFYADVTGMDRFFGCKEIADGLKFKIFRDIGLPISYALGTNKLITKIATNEVKPDGSIVIPPGSEREYLKELKIEKMPGIGRETSRVLHEMGIVTLGDLSRTPVNHLRFRLGNAATSLVSKSKGEDDSAVVPYHDQKSISKEETFNVDTRDDLLLNAELIRMCEKLGFLLRKQKKLCASVSIKLRYSDFKTLTRQAKILPTSSDDEIINIAKKLLEVSYDRTYSVRLLGVKVSELVNFAQQSNLFDNGEKKASLYKALDDIRTRFGPQVIGRSVTVPLTSRESKNDDING